MNILDSSGYLSYPPPIVSLRYFKDPFNKEFIIDKSFQSNSPVPVIVELEKPAVNIDLPDDLYVTIENVQVVFVVQDSVPININSYPGHLYMIRITWPTGFKLERGSRIVFTIKYNYHRKKKIVETGEVIEQIIF